MEQTSDEIKESGREGVEMEDRSAPSRRLRSMFVDAFRAHEEFATEAEESYRFVGHQQWNDEDRERLHEQRRPTLTINKMLPNILFLMGLFRQQRTEPQLLPFERSDIESAQVMQQLLKWVSIRSREPMVDDEVFKHKLCAGIGWWKIVVDFESDATGIPRWLSREPLNVFPDPNFWVGGVDAMRYVCDACWYAIDEAKELWPEHAESIARRTGDWLGSYSPSSSSIGSWGGGGDGRGDPQRNDRMFWDKEQQRVRIVEIWYTKYVQTTVVVLNESQEIVSDPAAVKRLTEATAIMPELASQFTIVNRPVKQVFQAHIMDDIVLDDEPSPWTEQTIPMFPSVTYQFWKYPNCPAQVMKDPQREINKRRSMVAEMVGRMPQSGFFNHQTGGAKTEDLEDYAHGNGVVINHQGNVPTPIKPPELPQALVFLETRSDADINAVTNVTPELLGNTTQRTVSGRAITARQQSGLIVQETLLEKTRQDKEFAVRFMIKAIQQWFSVDKAYRVIGSLALREPEGETSPLQILASTPFGELLTILNRAMLADYDIVVDNNRPWDPNMGARMMSVFQELAETFPNAIPPDVLADTLVSAGLINEKQRVRMLQFAAEQLSGVPPTIPGVSLPQQPSGLTSEPTYGQ